MDKGKPVRTGRYTLGWSSGEKYYELSDGSSATDGGLTGLPFERYATASGRIYTLKQSTLQFIKKHLTK